MAYDHGSRDLGLSNPLRLEGLLRAIASGLIALVGAWVLLRVFGDLGRHPLQAWVNAGAGLALLLWGLKGLAGGLQSTLRFFVGRSVPVSLARNLNPSEARNAEAEAPHTAYAARDLEAMLMGRKNPTLGEPVGVLAQLLHSLWPRLIGLPWALRNMAQDLAGLIADSLIAVLCAALAAGVARSGLMGAAGQVLAPLLSIILLVYLLALWLSRSSDLARTTTVLQPSRSLASLLWVPALALLAPAALVWVYGGLGAAARAQLQTFSAALGQLNAGGLLAMLFIAGTVVCAITVLLLRERLRGVDAQTEVSEHRSHLQEAVHPGDIFIHLENQVLANRRYRDIPNRIYQSLEPELSDASQGKGSFRGQLLAETQPAWAPLSLSPATRQLRLLGSGVGLALTVLAALCLAWLAGAVGPLADHLRNPVEGRPLALQSELSNLFQLACLGLGLLALGQVLVRATHVFWAEMTFDSLLLWVRAEGTWTESRLSTGMALHDSTRSENVVVRASISPWILCARLVTSTQASSGTNNLEQPRLVLALHPTPDELGGIVDEISHFLRQRENLAGIVNAGDLGQAHTLHQINQHSRHGGTSPHDDAAAARLPRTSDAPGSTGDAGLNGARFHPDDDIR
ncbi:hypothetical protein [Amphibiibacter pelophylacis]|uniref:Uncharacterized protein n=1 Tax=Amphibiibacter pelophylacis TaxID=1799477 RepID=A0ACC6NZE9_9BURK